MTSTYEKYLWPNRKSVYPIPKLKIKLRYFFFTLITDSSSAQIQLLSQIWFNYAAALTISYAGDIWLIITLRNRHLKWIFRADWWKNGVRNYITRKNTVILFYTAYSTPDIGLVEQLKEYLYKNNCYRQYNHIIVDLWQ